MFSAVMQEAFRGPSDMTVRSRTDISVHDTGSLSKLKAKKAEKFPVCDLLSADDCALLSHNETSMQKCVDSFSSACENFGLTIGTF